jgi:excisionase family DNA binding protein
MTIATATAIMTLSEVSEYLRVKPEVILQQVTLGQLPGRKLGEEWRFFKGAIDRWLSTSASTVTHQTILEAQARNPQLIELLESWNDPKYADEQTETLNILQNALPEKFGRC